MAPIEVTRCELVRHGRAVRATVALAKLRGLLVVVTMEPRSGRLAISQLSVEPDPMYPSDRSEVSSSVLRSVPVLQIGRAVLAHLDGSRERPDIAELARRVQSTEARQFAERWNDGEAALDGGAAPGVGRPRLYTDDLLAEIARAACTLHASGSGVHAGLVRQFPTVLRSKQQARDAVRRARHHGFLAPARRGTIDIQAGPRLAATDTNGDTQ